MRHPVEERLQRLLAIMAGVAGRGPVPLAELSERYRVSTHQLRKDLTLAQFIGVPPYTLPGETAEVVFHGDSVEVWVPGYLAQQPTLTRPEAFAVLAAGRAAVELNPDLDALRAAMDKLAGALQLEGGVEVDIESAPHLDAVREAVDGHRRLRITYWSAWRDELTKRRVDPLQVVFSDGNWYLLAVDDLSGGQRRFRVDRIVECTDTGEVFDPPAFEPMSDVFEPPPFAESVTVRFPSDAAWVTEYVDVEVTAEDDDTFTAVVTSVGERWLARLLLRTGGEVLEPAPMLDIRAHAARDVLARYGAGD
jgi:proteasome accessory factor C